MKSNFVIETVDLKWICPLCKKSWINQKEMISDHDIQSDLDYDEFVFIHQCQS